MSDALNWIEAAQLRIDQLEADLKLLRELCLEEDLGYCSHAEIVSRLRQSLRGYRTDLASTRVELAAAQRDSARLDYIESRMDQVHWAEKSWLVQGYCKIPEVVNYKPGSTWNKGEKTHSTLRGAIDSTMDGRQ